jgi:hypothetical protein
MNTVTLFVPHGKFSEVFSAIRNSGVKFYPVNKTYGGWKFELDNHPIASFLILKYDLNTIK